MDSSALSGFFDHLRSLHIVRESTTCNNSNHNDRGSWILMDSLESSLKIHWNFSGFVRKCSRFFEILVWCFEVRLAILLYCCTWYKSDASSYARHVSIASGYSFDKWRWYSNRLPEALAAPTVPTGPMVPAALTAAPMDPTVPTTNPSE